MLIRLIAIALLARVAWVITKDFLPGAWKKAEGSPRERMVVIAIGVFVYGFLLWGLAAALVGDVSLGVYTERSF